MFPSRADRRNEFHGRKPTGNTKPQDREARTARQWPLFWAHRCWRHAN